MAVTLRQHRAPRPPREADLLADIRLALADDPDLVLWRNSTGVAERPGGAARLRYGLARGSADLCGILTVRHHGRVCGLFVALEVKRPAAGGSRAGRVTDEQWLFLDLVAKRGGIAGVVHSVEEARDVLDRARGDAAEADGDGGEV